jgi:gliding motility-associated-like protein
MRWDNDPVYVFNSSWFYPGNDNSIIDVYHIYFKEFFFTSNTPHYNVRANRITKDSAGWNVKEIDQFPDNYSNVNRYVPGRAQSGYDYFDSLPRIYIHSDLGQSNNHIIYLENGQIDSSQFGLSQNLLSALAFHSFLHPLTRTRLMLRSRVTQNVRDSRTHLEEFILLPNHQLFATGNNWPLAVPPIQANGDHFAWFPTSIEISPQGRYLFAFMYSFADYMGQAPKLMRYDLFANDSASFVNSASEIPLPSRYDGQSGGQVIYDMKSAPDGNIYFIAQKDWNPWRNYSHHRQLGRITHPDTSDPFWIGFNDNYHTFPPYTLHRFFPNRMPGELSMAPFQQLTYCPDSVRLHFNYPAVTDSLWWSFGDTTLGAANHDTATHPVIPYTEPGKYPVSVELWWKGRQLRTLVDTVRVKPEPELDLPGDTALCPGDTLFLDGRQGFPAQYSWNTGSTDSTLTVRDSGYYHLSVSTSCGTVSDSLRVQYLIEPQERPLPDTVLCQGDSLLLDVSQPGAVQYRWADGITQPRRWVDSAGSYRVTLQTGCDTLTEEAHLTYERCGCRYHVPNAFSPNGDGVNERFKIKYACEEVQFELQILNRWGQVIFRQDENTPAWDGSFQGQQAPEGVYLYRLVFRGGQGDHFLEEEEHGTLVLMR